MEDCRLCGGMQVETCSVCREWRRKRDTDLQVNLRNLQKQIANSTLQLSTMSPPRKAQKVGRKISGGMKNTSHSLSKHAQITITKREILSCIYTKEHVKAELKSSKKVFRCLICFVPILATALPKSLRDHVRQCCARARTAGRSGCSACSAVKHVLSPHQGGFERTACMFAYKHVAGCFNNAKRIHCCPICEQRLSRDDLANGTFLAHVRQCCVSSAHKGGKRCLACLQRNPHEIVKTTAIKPLAKINLAERPQSITSDVKRHGKRTESHFAARRCIADSNTVLSEYKQERSLDGSAGYWSFARENGRFGSHPTFDKMDDESSPD